MGCRSPDARHAAAAHRHLHNRTGASVAPRGGAGATQVNAVPGDPGGGPATPYGPTAVPGPADSTSDQWAPAVTCGRGAGDRDSGLDRLRRQYPRWRIWHGHTTGDYWALPPPDHPTKHELIGASGLDELAWRLAQAEQQYDL